MKNFVVLLLSSLVSFAVIASPSDASSRGGLAAHQPMNCVNPGGSCNGTVPCCDSYNNACFRNRCQRVQGDGLTWLQSLGQASQNVAQQSR